ncbi:MAG: tetratricopeptide repeat protein [bacterium]
MTRPLFSGHLLLSAVLIIIAIPSAARAADGQPKNGLSVKESTMGPVLVGYYKDFLESRDVDKFTQNLLARYSEATLLKLIGSTDVEVRRASVLSLGLIGGAESVSPVGKTMQDKDSVVRQIAENGLWGIWFRASTPENNRELMAIRELVGEERLDEAQKRLDTLIKKAPDYAEAWNQRAIVHYARGDYEKSVADCREVVKRNPYHYGALSGMGQCLIRQNKLSEAQQVFTDLLKIQPFNEAIKVTIENLQRGLT